MGDADRREGRGRLSSIDLLPDEAEPDVVWALAALRERKMPLNAILAEFNARLADRGIGSISKSAWSRYAVRKAIQFRQLDEVRRISDELVQSLGTDGPDQVTVAVAEMVKLAAFRLLERGLSTDEMGVGSKEVMELSRAVASAVTAQKVSADHRKRLEDQVKAKVDRAIDAAGDKLAGDHTLADPKAVLKAIREDVYGIFER
ncbi:uncharacterized protein DUF3486 [Hephaestia caeni]|uniref:Uncharacterized protein DUF3486 n=1 Tax=Hephaestia caeni TaxID=645617 RepID=A0A397P590_9SPHN|nr:phage protein Gp27 family protein [Hephaestia caeni]RIA44058.1 uncharacterized protein DUF3486 [Hephaestia caeni]